MSLEVQTALCILSLLGKRRGVMRVNKISAYLLGVQEKFPTNSQRGGRPQRVGRRVGKS